MANDMMPTSVGDIHVPGWDHMWARHRARGRVLWAMVELELDAALRGGEQPTQKSILEKANELGATYAPTSVKAVSAHIKTLIEEEHVVMKYEYAPADKSRPGHWKPVGAKTSPWRTVYVSTLLSNALRLAMGE